MNNACFGQELPAKNGISIPADIDSTSQNGLEIPKSNDFEKPQIKETDTIRVKDSLKIKETLTGVVKYQAKDYIKINRKEKLMYLYNEAVILYEDIEIKAGKIIINYEKSEVYAFGIKDSTGYIQAPVFKQGESIVEPDSIKYNFKTQKALIYNSRTEQNGLNIKAERTKKENDSVYYVSEAIITTAKNLDDPEYHWRLRKAKFVPEKKIVAGFTNMYIYGVPTPIAIPFAYFPLTEKRNALGPIYITIVFVYVN